MALDLSLRARSNSTVSLDTFMREMWFRYGKHRCSIPGTVCTPYTLAGFESTLASVSGSPAFAHTFVQNYISGTKKPDFASVFLRGGLSFRVDRSQPSLGSLDIERSGDAYRVSKPTIVAPRLTPPD